MKLIVFWNLKHYSTVELLTLLRSSSKVTRNGDDMYSDIVKAEITLYKRDFIGVTSEMCALQVGRGNFDEIFRVEDVIVGLHK